MCVYKNINFFIIIIMTDLCFLNFLYKLATVNLKLQSNKSLNVIHIQLEDVLFNINYWLYSISFLIN